MSDNGAEAIDTSAVDPEEFARTIGKTPDEGLREAMQSPMRDQIIGEIFKRMEEHYRGGGQSAVIHWKITGRADGGEDVWEAVVNDGTCSTSPCAARVASRRETVLALICVLRASSFVPTSPPPASASSTVSARSTAAT